MSFKITATEEQIRERGSAELLYNLGLQIKGECSFVVNDRGGILSANVLSNDIKDDEGNTIEPELIKTSTGEYLISFPGLKQGTIIYPESVVQKTAIATAEARFDSVELKSYNLQTGLAEDANTFLKVVQQEFILEPGPPPPRP